MKTAIVIPAYNEESSIATVVEGVLPHGIPIVVDDRSSDKTAEIAEEAGAVVVRNAVRKGYDGSIQNGFERAASMKAEAVATIDGDGQHNPELLKDLLQPIHERSSFLVLGIRPKPARFSEHLFDLYTKIRFGVPDILCGMKAYRISLYHDYGCFDSCRSVGTELALHGLRRRLPFATVPVPILPRNGKSRFGVNMHAEYRILRAMILGILRDLRGTRRI
jgi:glycosyltransferase involved in cell wall biosynthesis